MSSLKKNITICPLALSKNKRLENIQLGRMRELSVLLVLLAG